MLASISRYLGFVVLVAMASLAQAQVGVEPWQAGVHYREVEATEPAMQGPVTVEEYFGYPCGGCAAFEPHFEAWVKRQGDRIAVELTPIAWGEAWAIWARIFHAARALELQNTHAPIFRAIHQQGLRAGTVEEAAQWLAKTTGADVDATIRAARSVDTEIKVNRATRRAMQLQVESTPSLLIGGRWLVDGKQLASWDEMLQVADFLVERERSRRAVGAL